MDVGPEEAGAEEAWAHVVATPGATAQAGAGKGARWRALSASTGLGMISTTRGACLPTPGCTSCRSLCAHSPAASPSAAAAACSSRLSSAIARQPALRRQLSRRPRSSPRGLPQLTMAQHNVIVCDLGGTNCRFQVWQLDKHLRPARMVVEQVRRRRRRSPPPPAARGVAFC